MYALIVESSGVTSVTIHNHLEDATSSYDEQDLDKETVCLLRVSLGKPFGLNEVGSFGGEEIISNL
jgi:hypothetical protein